MSVRDCKRLATAAVLILLIASGVAASGADTLIGKPAKGTVVVKKIDVIRGRDGVQIEITGSGPLSARTMHLQEPERFVIDVQDAVPDELFTRANSTIPVDTPEIKAVRIGRFYQQGDRVTRVVVDLATARDMEVTTAPNKLRVKLRPELQVAAAVPAQERPSRVPVETEVPKPGPDRAVEAASTSSAKTSGVTPEVAVQEPQPALQPVPEAGTLTNLRSLAAGGAAPVPPSVELADAGHDVAPASANQSVPEVNAASAPTGNAPSTEAATQEPQPVLQSVPEAGTLTSSRSLISGGVAPLSPSIELADTARDVIPTAANPNQNVPETSAAAAPTEAAPEPSPAPITPAAPVGVGVTGKSKDKALGSDEEAEIRETMVVAQTVPNGGAGVPFAMRLSGAATAGYYQASTANGPTAREASPIGSVRFDSSGYVHSPGFLNFNFRPQASAGRPSSEGMFPDGEGISGSATFLSGGVAPLSVSYHRLNRKLMTFGPLDRLAGLDANTFQNSLGANWGLHARRLPEINLNFSRYSDSYEPLAALAPKSANAGRLLSGDITQKVLGWNLQTRYKRERAAQDLINIFDPTQAPYLYQRRDQETRASADRQFGNWLSAAFLGGTTKSQNEVQGRPFDQSFRFLTGNSFLRLGKKLTLAFHTGVTDNIVGASLDRALGGTSAPDQPFLLLPTQAKLQMLSHSGSAQYAFTNDLRVSTDVVRETARAPQASSLTTGNSELTSLQAGISFMHHFRRWQWQSAYAANGGRFSYATGSSRSLGHRANLGVTVGSLRLLELTTAVHGSLQNVTGNTYVHDRSAGANVTLSRTFFGHTQVRASYDRERDQYKFADAQFLSIGNGATVSIVNPRAELSASFNLRDGLTFQADPRLQLVSSGQSGLLLGAFPGTSIVPTGVTWSNASVSIHPVPKLTARAGWMRSQQRLQGATNNQYTEWEASAGYQFRSISIDLGYVLHDQNFLVDRYKRNRFFLRIVREFTLF